MNILYSPFEQFKVFYIYSYKFIGIPFFFSNFTFYNLMVYIIITVMFIMFYKNLFYSNLYNQIIKGVYKFTYSTLEGLISNKGFIYIPFFQYIFFFIVICNLIGMIPYSFSITSHIAFVFGLSLMMFIGLQIIGLVKFGYYFFTFFLPSGVPLYMTPFLVIVEFISYIFRVISLSIRLVANIISGHILLKLIMGFIFNMISKGSFFFLAFTCIILIIALICLEFGIALLQAYVYLVLCAIYAKDVLTIDEH